MADDFLWKLGRDFSWVTSYDPINCNGNRPWAIARLDFVNTKSGGFDIALVGYLVSFHLGAVDRPKKAHYTTGLTQE